MSTVSIIVYLCLGNKIFQMRPHHLAPKTYLATQQHMTAQTLR